MTAIIDRFWNDETGNTTVDWLVLTAGIVMLGAAVSASLGQSSKGLADDTAAVVESRQVGI